MKQFDEWWEKYGTGFKEKMAAGEYINKNIITIEFFGGVTEDAFRAGMLAAADIAKDCYSRDEAHSIEWAIREEAK